MDSMTAVEIKQTLEREFEIFLSSQEIRSLTFAKLQELQDARYAPKEASTHVSHEPTGFDLFLQNFKSDTTAMLPVVKLPSLAEDHSDAPIVFAFPGIEGYVETLKPLSLQLKSKVIGLQCCYKVPPTNFVTTAAECFEEMSPHLKTNDEVNIVAFSWGTIIALEVISRLEKKGHKVNLIVLDGGPEMVREMLEGEIKATNETQIHVTVLCMLMLKYYPLEVVAPYQEILSKCSSSKERLEVFLKAIEGLEQFTAEYKRTATIAICQRVMECLTYKPSYGKIDAASKLFKPSSPLHKSLLPEDYNLSKICQNLQEIKVFEGNHMKKSQGGSQTVTEKKISPTANQIRSPHNCFQCII